MLGVTSVYAQLKINANSVFKAKGTLSTSTQITNASASTNLSEADLNLVGTDQIVSTVQPLKVFNLKVDQGGAKTISGDWEVSNTMLLINGIVTIGPNAKLIYSGTQLSEGNSNSFVNGFLSVIGTGRKFFPIGTGTTYAPLLIESTSANQVGARAIAGNANVTLPEGVSELFTGHFWELDQTIDAPVQLSQNGLGDFLNGASPVVLEAPSTGAPAQSLSGSFSGTFISSVNNATQPILVIGKGAEFKLVIHDMITPYTLDEINDKLFIENIGQTTSNEVKLLDRWGNVVAEWNNFTNDVEYDFSKLSPGNYICLVTYSAQGQNAATAKGMVTILKSN